MASSGMITVTGLDLTYDDRRVLHGVDLTVGPSQMIAVTGPSGAGKSTLLRVLGGIEPPTAGLVEVGGLDVGGMSPRERRRYRRNLVGFVFQDGGLDEARTVRENLTVAARAMPATPSGRPAPLRDACHALGVDCWFDTPVHRLSGGEKQRVALAQLLVRRPPLVLADEPTAALDRDNAELVVLLLRGLCDQGATVITATHDDRLVLASDEEFRIRIGRNTGV
ncbi:ABC transporter ATP-binding protein [Curtobacterium sp. VKM Ac-1395]|uniref:ABC transporter ATP-binding protein n=1 Tax=Curtobacterium sp. VKM Ac-1395 TaxID=2783815 RepID=UPI00188CCE35|nr:ATP-binding cassette domain-containing protein [Curtobacterium sp. VKM Ac-1395]MBF4588628.1 ATP-binding cassette domain-containing protein [Curtobacterium sp. VKM Ac-1395]